MRIAIGGGLCSNCIARQVKSERMPPFEVVAAAGEQGKHYQK
jgi:hypothetical protein